jgi:hypothetical protein
MLTSDGVSLWASVTTSLRGDGSPPLVPVHGGLGLWDAVAPFLS